MSPNWKKLGHKGHLSTRNKFPKRDFLKSKDSLPILDELKNLGVGGTRRNP
jgi:hypothetical protein